MYDMIEPDKSVWKIVHIALALIGAEGIKNISDAQSNQQI